MSRKSNFQLYRVWDGIIQRCYNPNAKNYHNYVRNDLRSPEGFRKATERPMNKFVENLAKAAKEHYENTLCECWLFDYGNHHHYCNGTKEREICHCNGDIKKCDFYPEKRGENK